MFSRLFVNRQKVKQESERRILSAGGKVNSWLPILDHATPRKGRDIAGRALVLNALIQLGFDAPIDIIRAWLTNNALLPSLSPEEHNLISKQDPLSEQDQLNMKWRIEALWALMWAGSLVVDLSPISGVGPTLAGMLPNIQEDETAEPFTNIVKPRSYQELYQMLDWHYRAHWYTVDGRVAGYNTTPFHEEVIMERRQALEWVFDRTSEWDNTDMNT